MLDGTNSAPSLRWPREQVRVITDGRTQYRPANDPQRSVLARVMAAEPHTLSRPSDRDLLGFMQRRGPVSGSELAEWMRVPYKAARDRLQVLQAIGRIRHEGGFWHVVPMAAMPSVAGR
jgi:predicted transcriptional regulator